MMCVQEIDKMIQVKETRISILTAIEERFLCNNWNHLDWNISSENGDFVLRMGSEFISEEAHQMKCDELESMINLLLEEARDLKHQRNTLCCQTDSGCSCPK